MLLVHRPLWRADIRSLFVSCLPRCIAKQGWQHLAGSMVLAVGGGRNDPKIGYTGNIRPEDAKTMKNKEGELDGLTGLFHL